jgi:hypothetical protein
MFLKLKIIISCPVTHKNTEPRKFSAEQFQHPDILKEICTNEVSVQIRNKVTLSA